jgi:HAD superfamily hydrolase (TIGR01509 family)
MEPIKAVLFDLWGTLIRDDPAVGEQRRTARIDATYRTLRELGFAYERADVEAGFIVAELEHTRVHEGGIDLTARGRTMAYVQHVDADLSTKVDEDGWRHLDNAVLTQMRGLPPVPMPHARETLESLKRRDIPIGLVSNAGATPGFVLREILASFGLLQYLDVLVFSDEVELAKPSPAIFQRALDLFRLAPEQAAFVGDQPVLDVRGSRQVGMWTIQIGDLPPDGFEPHGRIASLDELEGALLDLELIPHVG